MGYGNYSDEAHAAIVRTRAAAPAQQVFQQRACHPLMSPRGVKMRESRDSDAHPGSIGVVFALDVTGSMGDIPRLLAERELPRFMKVLGDCRVRDPQLLFCAVGDATSDQAPLQVGQFESTAELMDQWLTWSFLEGGGGGSGEESYELAMYFLAVHTEMDCVVKRGRRGYLFMTGDELPYPRLSRHTVESVTGDHLDDDLTAEEIVAELQKTFDPFFIIPDPGRAGRCERRWRDLLGDHVLVTERPEDICNVAAGAVSLCEGAVPDLDALAAVLRAAGAHGEEVARAMRALRPLADGGSGPAPETGGIGMAIKRLFVK
ncbi:MAG TPA: hypothetical protein VKB80_02920 [Kofleriaceae bacterium]|nr:hypothetical protein [Kofleriaceae bacterium]